MKGSNFVTYQLFVKKFIYIYISYNIELFAVGRDSVLGIATLLDIR